MTTELDDRQRIVDPGLLEILGVVSEVLGLAEHAQVLIPARRRAAKRHRRIDKVIDQFTSSLDDGRAAVRLLRGVISESTPDVPPGAIGFRIPATELPIYRSAVDQLHTAVRGMTSAAYELESLTEPSAHDTEHFYRISQAGQPILRSIAATLTQLAEPNATSIAPLRPVNIGDLLAEVDQYLTKCAAILEERDKWFRG